MGPLAALLIGATTLVRVDLAEDLDIKQAHDIAQRYAAAVERRTARPTVAETRPTGRCTDDEAGCVREIQARTGADRVVILRLYRAVTTIGLFAKIAGGPSFKAELSSDPSGWDPTLTALAENMFARTMPRIRTGTTAIERFEPSEERSIPILPPIILASGVVLGATALGLQLRSNGQLSDIEERVDMATREGTIYGLRYNDVKAEYDRVNRDRDIALGLTVGAAAALATGVIWWLLSE